MEGNWSVSPEAPRMEASRTLDPAVERLLIASRERGHEDLAGPERRAENLTALAFGLAALAFLFLAPAERHASIGLVLVCVLAYALTARVEFHTGAGWTVPTELVFVPMLFLLPLNAVPLLVAAALVVSRLPEILRGTVHPTRIAVSFGIAWHSLGPALVFTLAGVDAPSWSDWPIYVAALGAQILLDIVVSSACERLGHGVPLNLQLRESRVIYAVDCALAPVGLLAAFASEGHPYVFLLVLPVVGLLGYFARERQARINNALSLSSAYRGTALLLGELLSASDEYTGDHSRSVVTLSMDVAEGLRLDDRLRRDVELGALLHDVGKITVPKAILHKPGPLTTEEFDVMKQHVINGQAMLDKVGGTLGEAGYVVRTHHERFDGTGYPDGLAGEEIPLPARIIAACDAFNAMTTDRPYRGAMPTADAIAELEANSGSQFDPVVATALIEVLHHGPRRAHDEPPAPEPRWLGSLLR